MAFPRLVDVDEAKRHLRVTHDADDTLIARLCDNASAIVLVYLWQFPRTEYQSLPVLDPLNPPGPINPWPWAWPLSSVPPYWWPATRISYQQLPAYELDTWFTGSPAVKDLPGDVHQATILVIHNLYDKPQEDPISLGVRSILAMRRDPAMA